MFLSLIEWIVFRKDLIRAEGEGGWMDIYGESLRCGGGDDAYEDDLVSGCNTLFCVRVRVRVCVCVCKYGGECSILSLRLKMDFSKLR